MQLLQLNEITRHCLKLQNKRVRDRVMYEGPNVYHWHYSKERHRQTGTETETVRQTEEREETRKETEELRVRAATWDPLFRRLCHHLVPNLFPVHYPFPLLAVTFTSRSLADSSMSLQ